MLSAIDAIVDKLGRKPDARYERRPGSITVFPIDVTGFPVTFEEWNGGERFTVSFAGWHEEFVHQADALNCFAFGLSSECRLRVTSRGSFAYKWTVQSSKDGNWQDASETGLLLFPFWRRSRVTYLQNRYTLTEPK